MVPAVTTKGGEIWPDDAQTLTKKYHLGGQACLGLFGKFRMRPTPMAVTTRTRLRGQQCGRPLEIGVFLGMVMRSKCSKFKLQTSNFKVNNHKLLYILSINSSALRADEVSGRRNRGTAEVLVPTECVPPWTWPSPPTWRCSLQPAVVSAELRFAILTAEKRAELALRLRSSYYISESEPCHWTTYRRAGAARHVAGISSKGTSRTAGAQLLSHGMRMSRKRIEPPRHHDWLQFSQCIRRPKVPRNSASISLCS